MGQRVPRSKVQFESIDSRVLPEMSAKVAFLSRDISSAEQQPLTAVNSDAIVTRDNATVVYAVRNDRAIEVPVKAGVRLGDLTAITGEVKAGERVVSKPAGEVVNGSIVKLATK